MALCCTVLENLVSDMGKRGLSVVLKSEMGLTFFCLQARAVDAAEMEQIVKSAPMPGSLARRIRLTEQTAIAYCPACGYKLEKWIAEHPKEAEELIGRSRPFVM